MCDLDIRIRLRLHIKQNEIIKSSKGFVLYHIWADKSSRGSGPAKTNNSRFSGLCPQITVTAINLQIPAEDSTR